MKRVFLLFCFLFVSCSSLTNSLLRDPEVKVTDVKVTGVNANDISVDVVLNVKNDNPVELYLDQVNYELSFSGETVTEGIFKDGLSVPASGQSRVTLPLKFQFKSVGNILSGLINRSFTREYELRGSARIGLFSIPFSQKGAIDLDQ